MYTFDEIIKEHKKELKELISRFKEEINKNHFKTIYEYINNHKHHAISSAFTALLLKNNINPLAYMDFVPDYFA